MKDNTLLVISFFQATKKVHVYLKFYSEIIVYVLLEAVVCVKVLKKTACMNHIAGYPQALEIMENLENH